MPSCQSFRAPDLVNHRLRLLEVTRYGRRWRRFLDLFRSRTYRASGNVLIPAQVLSGLSGRVVIVCADLSCASRTQHAYAWVHPYEFELLRDSSGASFLYEWTSALEEVLPVSCLRKELRRSKVTSRADQVATHLLQLSEPNLVEDDQPVRFGDSCTQSVCSETPKVSDPRSPD